MTKKSFAVWLIYALISFMLWYGAIYFWRAKDYLSATMLVLFSSIILYLLRTADRKRIKETEKILRSIIQKDFSLFHESKTGDELRNAAVILYQNAQSETLKALSYKMMYENILSKMEIGMVILEQKKGSSTWEVFYTNPTILALLQIPKYNYWEWYADKIPNFYKLIEQTQYKDSQEFFEISILQSQQQSYSVRTSRIDLQEQSFFTISIESIQKIIDKKEKQAWNNLMKVISHELLNTLTPLNSLLQNLQYISQQNEFTVDDREEIRESLRILNGKSQQLLHFIDNYRQVAELPKPKFSSINLKLCIEKIVHLYENKLKSEGVLLQTQLQEVNIAADEKMITRVLINLLLNALFAVKYTDDKTIKIQTQTLPNRVVIRVSDSGMGIAPEIQDKIYLPFFTTRGEGSGIGLTLSKSIVEAHGGYLNHKNLEQGSQFEIWLPR